MISSFSRTALLGVVLVFTSTVSTADTLNNFVASDGTPLLPDNFRSWEFLGSFTGLAPDKNGSHEMHSVYASPGTVEYYQENASYPDGAVLVKEVLETNTENLTTGRISYATKTKGWFVWIKDKKNRFPESKLWGDGWGWAFYAAGDKPVLQTTDYKNDCLGCHIPAKDTDYSYIRGYPTLQAVLNAHDKNVSEKEKAK
ncbi:cytochrome P460 family protein [Pseudoalteromonas sp. APC 3358]|uniref:cytochrome P460 family protein n=1 Tax=Pseudoalteromonas sp. APC 3358 TaxID=3035176 RepID=UPI0025B4003C|nr:cytochrome P460 family protein [Pseudoalteromonas sp. APC 3358]MDN3385197.1 cytochrome P460 family protein [Pseudoalteromonas sp. APC 3358]